MRLKKETKYHGLSMPSPIIEQVKEHIKNKPQYRSVADFAINAIREKIYLDQLQFMREFYGEKSFNEIMSGNVSFETFCRDNLGFVFDEKTGKLVGIDPKLVKGKVKNDNSDDRIRKIVREEIDKK